MLKKTDMVEAGAPCSKKNDMLQAGASVKIYVVVCFKPELGRKMGSGEKWRGGSRACEYIGTCRPSSGRLVGAQSLRIGARGPVARPWGDRYLSSLPRATDYSNRPKLGRLVLFLKFFPSAVIFVITVS